MTNDIPPQPPNHSSPQEAPGGTASGSPSVPGRKGPIALLISGLVVALIGLIVVGYGIGAGVDGAMSAGSEQQALESETSYSIDVEPGSRMAIYTEGSTSVGCYAENAEGEPLSVDAPSSHLVINNRERVLIISTGPNDTTMNLACETDDGADYFVGKSVSGELEGALLPIIIGPIVMVLGFVLTIAGLIWLILRHSRIKQARARLP